MHFITNTNMSTSTRIMRSKGESDGLSLPMRIRPTWKDTISGRNGGMALNTTFNAGRDQQQQMPTQMPHLPTQSPQVTSAERTETTAPMLPPGPHRPLTPHMPLPASPTSSSWSSAPLFRGQVQLDLRGRIRSGCRSNIHPWQKPAQRHVCK